MSCMNLGKRLQPARKAWKIFTKKLHGKFQRLNPSKSIKKHKRSFKPTKKASLCTTIQSCIIRKNKKNPKTRIFHQYKLHKRPEPVYVDSLFNEPVVATKVLVIERGSTSSGAAKMARPDGLDFAGKRERAAASEGGMNEADDMWESLQLGSPLMHGIDERAERFIAKIKGEMQLQETMAFRL